MKSVLVWTAHPQYSDVTEARCGTRLVGSYQEFENGRFRWEMIPAFNPEHRYHDDSRGRAADAESARQEVERRFAACLAEMRLAPLAA